MDSGYSQQRILVAGTEKLALSICVCLLKAGHQVTLLNVSGDDMLSLVNSHISDIQQLTGEIVDSHHLQVINTLDDSNGCDIAIAITNENLEDKTAIIRLLEDNLNAHTLIAINIESIALSALQDHAKHPTRIIGANWVEPAHTTYFLEIITNKLTIKELASISRYQANWACVMAHACCGEFHPGRDIPNEVQRDNWVAITIPTLPFLNSGKQTVP